MASPDGRNPANATPVQIHEMLSRGEADLYLDVRSTPEFVQGHPAGAWHAPLLESDATGGMRPNADFARVVGAAFRKEQRIAVGCMTGRRSGQAVALLAAEGFTNLTNVAGGFGGERDPLGRVSVPGWAASGLPVETGDGGDRGYASLRSRIQGS